MRTIINKDMREQSENIRQRLAIRNKKRSNSMAKLDLSGVNVQNALKNQGKNVHIAEKSNERI